MIEDKIEVGDEVERINIKRALVRGGVPGYINAGDTCIVSHINNKGQLTFHEWGSALFLPNHFKVIKKGAEMNNIEKLKKEHKEMGETIKRMEDEESKAASIWTEDDIISGTSFFDKGKLHVFIEGVSCNSYNILTHGNFLMFSKTRTAAKLAKYLNANNYEKEA